MRGTVSRARRRLIAVLFLSGVLVCATIVLAMLMIVMMPGVAAGRLLASMADASSRTMRATAGPVSHRIVRQMAQRRGRRVEGQQPPADQIA
jgi:hypothetical protein